jgi:voltage-gated potassium channel
VNHHTGRTVAGRDHTESRLTRWERRSEWPLAVISLMFLAALSVQVLARPEGRARDVLDIGLVAVWGIFLFDYLVRLRLATARWRWFYRHIPDLLVVALPFLRPLRLLRLTYLLGRLNRFGMVALRGRLIMYTAVSVVLLVYVAALGVMETDGPGRGDEAVYKNFGAALWWSAATVATLGYGMNDPAPVSGPGRAIAVVLGFGGICLIGVVTATFSSWFVQQVAEEEAAEQAATSAEIQSVAARIDVLAAQLQELKSALGQEVDGAPDDGV